MPSSNRELLLALILLWHDHLEASHVIARGTGTPDGSFVHAIMHRCEPDYGNSKYWWRRVGRPATFSPIAARVTVLLEAKGERELLGRLVKNGDWNPFAFVDACEEAGGRAVSESRTSLLREVQRIEFETLLEHFCGAGSI